jgi:carboxypeptidase family protein
MRGRTNGTIRPAVFPALALAAALLLAVFGWRFLRSDRPDGEVSDSSASADPSIASCPRRDVPPAETILIATETPDRTPVAPIEPRDSPALAVTGGLRPETLVHGSLLDASHSMVGGGRPAGVRFVDRLGRPRSSDAGKEGTYALRALEFGTYWVTASADGYRSVDETIELRPERPSMQKDFTLQKSVELRVRLTTPDGKSLLDVLRETGAPRGARLLVPIATRKFPGTRFDEVTGSLNDRFGVGRFRNRDPRDDKNSPDCMGTLQVDCDLPVCVSLVHYQRVLQSKRVAGSQDEVTFVVSPDDLLLDLATIRVQVLDAATGLAIPRARVSLGGGTYPDPGVATDPAGIATIARREPGRFDLRISANGYEVFRKSIDALPGELTDLGTVALEQEVTVEGRVLDLEDHPLSASFSLGILDPVDYAIHWCRQEECRSSGDGSLQIRGLGRKEYVVRTGNHDALDEGEWKGVAWVSGIVLFDTRAGSISGLEIHLRPASKLVLQAGASAAAVAGDEMRFRVVDESGRELVAGLFHGSEPRPLALPAGSYVVSLLDSRGAVRSDRLVTLGSESVEVDLSLECPDPNVREGSRR